MQRWGRKHVDEGDGAGTPSPQRTASAGVVWLENTAANAGCRCYVLLMAMPYFRVHLAAAPHLQPV